MKAIYPFVSDTKNFINYSEDFTNIGWAKTGVTVTGNTTIAPDGTLTADTTNILSAGAQNIQQQLTGTPGQQYTFSFYCLRGTATDMKYSAYNYTGSADIVPPTSYYSQTNSSTWSRISFTFTLPSGCTNFAVYLTRDSASTGTFFIWGAQLELSSSASTYQPIATTPANRFVSQFKYNLKDARDLDAAFRLAFNGTWTYSKQGATPNGVNAYADTYSRISADFTPGSVSFSYYSRSNTTAPLIYTTEIGVGNGAPNLGYYELDIRRTSGNATTNMSDLFTNNINYTNPDSLGYYIANRNGASVLNLWKNNTKVGSNTTASTFNNLPTNNILIAAAKDGAIAIGNYSNRQTAFATLGNGLTDTEATNLYTSVQLFQQELSRYVGVPIVSDANAQAFLDAAVITDQTQANAVNTLVTDLKTYGLWTKMKAIYPFVGGTATTHKWNLKDPRDLDAAYRLAFSGAWTHSSTGALPNGTNAFADSFLIPNTALGSTFSLSYYSNTNTLATSANTCEIGAFQSGSQMIGLSLRRNLNADFFGTDGYGLSALSTSTTSNFFGIASRSSATSLKLWKNTTLAATNTSTDTGSKPTIKVTLALNNGLTGYSNRQCAFSHIGDGLSDTEVADLYTAVQKFNTTLTRNN
jgi:hypothetical protein